MDAEGLESVDKSIDRAVDLLDRLFEVADGGRGVVVGEYDASTILALLMDREYRGEVMKRMEEFEGIEP